MISKHSPDHLMIHKFISGIPPRFWHKNSITNDCYVTVHIF